MAAEPSTLADLRERADTWRKAGIGLGAALMIALAGAMGYVASSEPPLDAALLGLGALVMVGFALSGQWWWSRPPLAPPAAWLGLFGSRWLVYPLGLVLLVRFIVLPAELTTAVVGVVAGIVFLLPVVAFLLYVAINVGA